MWQIGAKGTQENSPGPFSSDRRHSATSHEEPRLLYCGQAVWVCAELCSALLRWAHPRGQAEPNGGCKIWDLTACSSQAPKHNWRAMPAMRRERKSGLCMVSEAFCVIIISLPNWLLPSVFLLCIFIHLPIFFLFCIKRKSCLFSLQ